MLTIAPEKAAIEEIPRAETENDSRMWEAPAGLPEAHAHPRTADPEFVYRGFAEPHWRGQVCHVLAPGESSADELVVAMACGCRACVPAWTLEARSAPPRSI